MYDLPHILSNSTIIPLKTTIDILSRTKWFETTNDKKSYWLKIKYNETTKWIKSLDFDSYKDYSIVNEDEIQKIKINSIISNGTVVNNKYNNENIKIMSLPNPINEPNTDYKLIFYTKNDYKICLYNYPKPQKEIAINLTSQSGFNLNETLSIYDYEINIITEDPFTGFPLNKHITTINYFPFATYSDRNWIIKLRIDDIIYEEEISLPYNQYSISDSETPNPFKDRSSGNYSVGDKIHFWGNRLSPNSELVIVLYKITDQQNEDLSFVMEPNYAFMVKVDQIGQFHSKILIGDDIKPGKYKLAYGDEENVEIDMWGSYFSISN